MKVKNKLDLKMKIDLEKCIHCESKATHGGMFCNQHRKIAIEKTLKKAKERHGDKNVRNTLS